MSAGPQSSEALVDTVRALLASALRVDALPAGRDAECERIARAAAEGGGDVLARAAELVQRVARGEPLAYVVGREQFMGVELLAGPGALVPREETALLGETALALLRDLVTAAPRVIDMCCGSGNAGWMPESRYRSRSARSSRVG